MRVTLLSLLTSTGIIGLCMANTSVAADSADEPVVLRKHGDWWLGLDAGAGAIHLEMPEGKISETSSISVSGQNTSSVLNFCWASKPAAG